MLSSSLSTRYLMPWMYETKLCREAPPLIYSFHWNLCLKQIPTSYKICIIVCAENYLKWMHFSLSEFIWYITSMHHKEDNSVASVILCTQTCGTKYVSVYSTIPRGCLVYTKLCWNPIHKVSCIIIFFKFAQCHYLLQR